MTPQNSKTDTSKNTSSPKRDILLIVMATIIAVCIALLMIWWKSPTENLLPDVYSVM